MRNTMWYKVIFSLSIPLLITSCGSNSTKVEQNTTIQTEKKIIGYLVDAPIANMDYICGGEKSKTDSSGKFICSKLPIKFMIGDFEIGTINKITKDNIIYPQDLAGVLREDISNPKVLKIASFLQSLDEDKNLSITIDIPNGIKIDSSKSLVEMSQEEANAILKENNIVPIPLKEAEAHLRENFLNQEATNPTPTPTPSPTPKPTPSPTATPTPSPTITPTRQQTSNTSRPNTGNNNSRPRPATSATIDNYPYIPKVIDDATAIRFLDKASFGATQKTVKHLQKIGIEAWVDEELSMSVQKDVYLKKMIEISKEAEPDNNQYTIKEYLDDNDKIYNQNVGSFHSPRYRMTSWFDTALTSKAQLQHKLTYALSQIIVESDFEPIFTRRGEALARYFDILHQNAFGSYKQLLTDISFSSGMGMFLTYNGNKKEYVNGAGVTVYPDENYAREIMQLFSIGLNELNIDGTPKKDSDGNLIPTYTQEDVNQLSKVFTGWDLKRNNRYGLIGFRRGDLTHPMEFTKEYHDFGEKKVLGQTIPANLSGEDDIKKAVDIIMSNSNVAPFVSKNLIMRLTKSNPTSSYVSRVATVFNSTQGDLKEVVKAILLDKEIWEDIKDKKVVKFKEPVVAYTNFLRTFDAKPFPKWYFCGYGGPDDDTASNCNIVTNQFLFNDTRDFLNQGAGLAPTVFNFYDNSFVPNSTDFKSTNSVAPEIQIQSDSVFIKFNNKIRADLEGWEQNYLTNQFMHDYKNDSGLKRYDTVEAYADDAPARNYVPVYYVGANKLLLDVSEELNVMEKVIDGDTNGDFLKLEDYREEDYHNDEKAIGELITHLNQKLTGGLLSKEQTDIIYNNLKDAKLYNKYDVHDSEHPEYDKKKYILRNAIFPAIRAIVTSSTFMTE